MTFRRAVTVPVMGTAMITVTRQIQVSSHSDYQPECPAAVAAAAGAGRNGPKLPEHSSSEPARAGQCIISGSHASEP